MIIHNDLVMLSQGYPTPNLLFSELFPKQAVVFTCLHYKSFENTVGKGEIARHEQFLLFPQRFLPFWRTLCHFHQIKNCRLQTLSLSQSLKSVVWERNKTWKSQVLTTLFRKLCQYWCKKTNKHIDASVNAMMSPKSLIWRVKLQYKLKNKK